MQVSWEVLHGQQKATGAATTAIGDTGIFVGIQQMEYGALALPHLHAIGPFSATGGPFSVAAGRLSYTYGFKGPAVSFVTKMTLPEVKFCGCLAVQLISNTFCSGSIVSMAYCCNNFCLILPSNYMLHLFLERLHHRRLQKI